MVDKLKSNLQENFSKISYNSNKFSTVNNIIPPPKQADSEIEESSIKTSQSHSRQKYTESRLNDESLYSEFNLNREQSIIFKVKDNDYLSFKKEFVLSACPVIANHKDLDLKNKHISVVLPKWITASMVREFFIYFSDPEYTNFSISSRQLLLIADYFDNQTLVSKILKDEIIPYLNSENCLMYLEDSFLKLNMKQASINKIWFDLFYESINFCGKFFIFLLLSRVYLVFLIL